MTTRYFRLLDPEFRAVAAVYRLVSSPDALVVERYDPTAGAWKLGPVSFLRFVNEGEMGADEISALEASAIIAQPGGLPALPEPV